MNFSSRHCPSSVCNYNQPTSRLKLLLNRQTSRRQQDNIDTALRYHPIIHFFSFAQERVTLHTMSTGARQRRSSEDNSSTFAEYVEEDTRLGTTEGEPGIRPRMNFVGRTLIFLAFPMLIGVAGLSVGYLRAVNDKSQKVDFDRDFIFPFLMALALVGVITVQTTGFTTSMKPLVQWPKVRRTKKIIRKRVIVDDNGNEVSRKTD
jgi:hypothetical protein